MNTRGSGMFLAGAAAPFRGEAIRAGVYRLDA
jgi:hypothetical protein